LTFGSLSDTIETEDRFTLWRVIPMNGNTKIKILGTTVKAEAIMQLRTRSGYPVTRKGIEETASEIIHTAKPGTIGGMVAEYLSSLSDTSFKALVTEILKSERM
jgi:hypothetical protein